MPFAIVDFRQLSRSSNMTLFLAIGITREVETAAETDEDVKLLQTVDGVGPITALGDIVKSCVSDLSIPSDFSFKLRVPLFLHRL